MRTKYARTCSVRHVHNAFHVQHHHHRMFLVQHETCDSLSTLTPGNAVGTHYFAFWRVSWFDILGQGSDQARQMGLHGPDITAFKMAPAGRREPLARQNSLTRCGRATLNFRRGCPVRSVSAVLITSAA